MRLVLGIDAGGTHTRCCVVDETGRAVSFAFGEPANKNFVSADSARAAIHAALSGSLGRIEGPVDVAVISGAHLPADFHDIISRRAGTANVIPTDEFEACLAAGLCGTGRWQPECLGVVVMAGTGSFCKGRSAAGREAYAGGWGPLIGDEGSGYDIAREALAAVARASDGRGDRTAMTDIALAHFAIQDVGELRRILYSPPIKRHELAGFAKCVFEASGSGDAVANEILEKAGRRLARLALPVLENLFGRDESFPVILCGGVFRRETAVSRALTTEINGIRPLADVFLSVLQPVSGTLVIGLHSMGARIDSEIVRNLEEGESKMHMHSDSKGSEGK